MACGSGRLCQRPATPASASASPVVAATDRGTALTAAHARLEEMKIQLAWLADATVFPSGMTMCAMNSSSNVVIPVSTASSLALTTRAMARHRLRISCL